MYIYHYYAIHELPLGGLAHMDGIIKRPTPVSGEWEDYQAIKEAIAGAKEGADPKKMTVCSLTLLKS